MATLVFNVAKGVAGHYGTLPAANDALIAVPIETAGLESDAVLKDYDNLAVLLAASNNEQTTMGRKTLTGVTSTVNDTDDRREVDCSDPVWSAATGNPVSAVLICYDPDTTGGTDTEIIPLVKLDMVVTPSGGDVTLIIGTGGFYQAQ